MCRAPKSLTSRNSSDNVPHTVVLVEALTEDGLKIRYFPEPHQLASACEEIIEQGERILFTDEVRYLGRLHTHQCYGQTLVESDYEMFGGNGRFLAVESTESFGVGYIDSDTNLKRLMARTKKGSHLNAFESA